MSGAGRAHDVMSVVPQISSTELRSLLERLSRLSLRGLAQMYDPRSRSFPHTVRGRSRDLHLVAEGLSVRYTAIATLGLSRMDEPARREVLAGQDLSALLPGVLGLALAGRDPGAIALSLWATIEAGRALDGGMPEKDRVARALDRLLTNIRTGVPVPTVDHAWTLVALLGAGSSDDLATSAGGHDQLLAVTQRAAQRLLAAQGPSGLFPHHLPARQTPRLRYHVSCFADQVYPIQALARYAAFTGDLAALDAAARCADRVVALQGERGQWWWHYDWRRGEVVEQYPVYSVHQHAMAPMALLELDEAGGPDHRAAIAAGLAWLVKRPESAADLIAEDLGVVWRKVGRHEPRKMVRTFRSAASAADPGLRLTWLDWMFRPGPVDRECRPFELGWLLYAWQADDPLTSEMIELEALAEAESATGAPFSHSVPVAGERP